MNRTYRFSLWLLAVILAAAGLVAAWWRTSSPPFIRAATGGPDFHRADADIPRPLRLVAYGDQRFTDPAETRASNPQARRWLVEQIGRERPDSVLLLGDVSWHGSDEGDYREYQAETGIWRQLGLHVYPALGNHEFSGSERQSLENWWNTFPELRGHRWYSVQLGSSVELMMLDSNLSLLPDSEQIAWLEAQLAALPVTVRLVVFGMHHPPVVDFQKNGDAGHNGRPNEKALADFLVRSPVRSRVRFLVLAGHIHNYERFFQNDIVYVVEGGGGAKPRSIERGAADLYQDSAFPNYSYVRIDTLDGKLNVSMIRLADANAAAPSWQEKDHFEVGPVRTVGAVTQGSPQ